MKAARHNRGRLVHKAPMKLDSVRNEINVTPLVDVCLVLLIIFMVILPMLARGKELPVPQTANSSKEKDAQQPIVAIDDMGRIYLDKEEIKDIEALKTAVNDEWKALAARNAINGSDRSGEGRVLLKAHQDAKYKQVLPVIMALHEGGAVGIDLGVNEQKQPGQAAE
jgi:biopolymer transport protein TolR